MPVAIYLSVACLGFCIIVRIHSLTSWFSSHCCLALFTPWLSQHTHICHSQLALSTPLFNGICSFNLNLRYLSLKFYYSHNTEEVNGLCSTGLRKQWVIADNPHPRITASNKVQPLHVYYLNSGPSQVHQTPALFTSIPSLSSTFSLYHHHQWAKSYTPYTLKSPSHNTIKSQWSVIARLY